MSTDERPDVEATPEQDTELQPVIPNEQVTVETLNSEETMKPMTMQFGLRSFVGTQNLIV